MQDVLVIGGGPAGVSAAIYARRAGLSVQIVAQEEGSLGRTDKIENYYGFAEPISGDALRAAGKRQAERLGISWAHEEVVSLEADGEQFLAVGQRAQYAGHAAVLATGASHAAPPIEGLGQHEGQGVSYCAVCDGFFYRGRAVAVLGNGRYALHEAEHLMQVAGSVTLVTNGLPAPKPLPQGLAVDTRKIRAVVGEDQVRAIAFESGDPLEVAGVFVALGVAGSDALARKLGVMTGGGKILVDESAATNVPGLFAAGDCTGGLRQIVKAVHEGAVAGMSAAAFVRASK